MSGNKPIDKEAIKRVVEWLAKEPVDPRSVLCIQQIRLAEKISKSNFSREPTIL